MWKTRGKRKHGDWKTVNNRIMKRGGQQGFEHMSTETFSMVLDFNNGYHHRRECWSDNFLVMEGLPLLCCTKISVQSSLLASDES